MTIIVIITLLHTLIQDMPDHGVIGMVSKRATKFSSEFHQNHNIKTTMEHVYDIMTSEDGTDSIYRAIIGPKPNLGFLETIKMNST